MGSHLDRVFPSWLADRLTSYRRGRKRQRQRRRRRLEAVLLPLEDRRLLSTFPVTSTADDGGTGTLPWAVDAANADTSPSTIVFELGTAPATITLTQGQLALSNTAESVTIDDGPGQGSVTISGNNASGAFQVDAGANASISGLTITGGATPETHGGGSINDLGTLTLSDCTITNNPLNVHPASGIYINGTADITDCTITGGNSNAGAGIDVFKGTAEINGCSIDDNTGGGIGVGAGVFNGGTTTLVNCKISGNANVARGGGVYNSNSGQLTMDGCTISGNTSANEGAGVYNGGTADLSGCTISSNSDDSTGGGVWNGDEQTIELSGCTISDNTAFVGGGLGNDGTATLANCTIRQNIADTSGGGVASGPLHTSAVLTLTDSTIADNTAVGGGGGVINYGQATLADSTIADNLASEGLSAAATGGGLDDAGTATLVACTIGGNTATADGGGIYAGGTLPVTLTLDNTIVAGNDWDPISGSLTPSDLLAASGSVLSGSHNLVGIGGSAGLANGINGNIVLTSLAGLDLAPLNNNGGPTETMALLPGSPAIAAGSAELEVGPQGTALTTDQRGLPIDSPPDIGAYQAYLPIELGFNGLTSPSIVYGTAHVTIAGILAGGNSSPSDTESVQITLDGVTRQATIGNGGAFVTTFDTSTLSASGTPDTIHYTYTGDGTYAAASATSTLTVSRATPVLNVADPGGTYNGSAFRAAATVTGVSGPATSSLEGATPSLSYYIGSSTAGTSLGSTPPTGAGTYTVVATFPGTTNYAATQSQPVTFTIARAGIQIVLVPQPRLKGKKVVSVVLTADILPAAPGGGVPTGALAFDLKRNKVKTTRTVTLAGGAATLTLQARDVLNRSITIAYVGDADFTSSTATWPAMTQQTLESLARPMVARHHRGRRHG